MNKEQLRQLIQEEFNEVDAILIESLDELFFEKGEPIE